MSEHTLMPFLKEFIPLNYSNKQTTLSNNGLKFSKEGKCMANKNVEKHSL